MRAGDLVLVRPTGPRGGHGKVVKRLGRPDTARDVLEALMLDRGLRRRFDPAVERSAREAAEHPPHGDAGPRRDLTALPTFTIDPPTARDFDDAISAERLDDGAIRVWVHIADVSAHVPPGSLVDREARRRGTSVYVPGKVEPMLPEALSNVACSLVPGQDRLAVTVELEFEGATLRRSAFTRSTIRSDARLDYPRVDRIFAGEEKAEAPWAEPLYAAREAAAALEAARQARGALAVETVEPEFDFSHEGHVTGLAGERDDRVAPPDRAPDDLRQRGGRRAARHRARSRRSTASTSARSRCGSSAWSSSSPRSTCRRRRCRTRCRRSRPRTRSGRSRAWSTPTCGAPAAAARR